MKRIIFTLMLAAAQVALWAVPAKRGVWKDITLQDGSTVRVELCGDEFRSFWQAEDGRCFVKDVQADCYVAVAATALQAEAVDARRKAAPNRVSIGGSHPAFVGSKKGLIILAEFTDMKFQPGHDAAYYSRIANEENFTSPDGHVGSIHDFFLAQSEGQFDLTFDVVGPIQLANNMAYYGGHSASGANDKNAGAMIREAVTAAAKELETFAPYDWFNDGYVDQVFVIYAGRGEASGGDENTIWPHRSQITRTTLGGKFVQVYACSNEMRSDTQIDGIGCFCHEFSHCLGLPDLYDVQYGKQNGDKEYYGMGYWDIMNSGCYLGDAFRPCSYSGYERNYCGWKDPIILTGDTVITELKGISEGGDYYIVYNDAYKKEYYILENRNKKGWDAAQYGSGLLITHIDFDQSIWQSNLVNSYYPNFNDHPRYTPFLADNNEREQNVNDIAGDVYPYKTNNQLTNYSVPNAMLYHNNKDGKRLMSKPITGITKHSDGTISFTFKNEVGKQEDDPMPAGCLFRETFKHAYGMGGNDGLWAGTDVATSDFIADNEGWVSAQKFGGNKCARFGTNAQRGIATTPEIEIKGDTRLTFLAAPWTGEASSVTITISGTATAATTSFPLEKEKWTECSTMLSGEGKVKIQFRSDKKRFFLDEVFLFEDDGSAIDNLTSAPTTTSTRTYNLMGQPVSTGYKGIVIQNGKKTLK